jgi:hypothetical protein
MRRPKQADGFQHISAKLGKKTMTSHIQKTTTLHTCKVDGVYALHSYTSNYKGNLTDLRRILHLSLAKGNPK